MAWIKMRVELPTDPRVVGMAAALGVTPEHIIGCLLKVWSVFDAHTTTGHLSRYRRDNIDEIAGQPGMAQALENVEWLVIDDTGATMPDFFLHNGESAKTRAYEQKRKARYRDMSPKTRDKCPGIVPKKPGPDKRREDIKRDASASLSEPPAKASKPRTPDPIWDTLRDVCHLHDEVDRGLLAKATADLKKRAAAPGAAPLTPEGIRRTHAWCLQKFDGKPFKATAIAKWYADANDRTPSATRQMRDEREAAVAEQRRAERAQAVADAERSRAAIEALSPEDRADLIARALATMPATARRLIGANPDPSTSRTLRAAMWSLMQEVAR